jgi:transposase
LILKAATDTNKTKPLAQENQALREQVSSLQNQVDWFKRQLFGSKSEKRLEVDNSQQADLLAALDIPAAPTEPPAKETITYQRSKKPRDNAVNDSGLRFDDTVPVETIEVVNPELAGIPADQLTFIDEKVTCRLAQRPGSYVVLRYVRKVFKRQDNQQLVTAPAPDNVLDKSIADVSFLAGMLVDKFMYHLPLYRQHQRLAQSGIQLSRATLTNLVARAIDLLKPIVDAQLDNILLSRVLAMDETPIKAGRKQKGKMRQAYFWPIYGEQNEIHFSYSSTRAHAHVPAMLGDDFEGTLLSDGYEAYANYAAQREKVTHAECWSHTRRYFERALDSEPESAEAALTIIGQLYKHEAHISKKEYSLEAALNYRIEHSLAVVKGFWKWCEQQCQRNDLLPKAPLTKALKYAMARVDSLQVFLSDPAVAIDTNHIERCIRPIPMGRRNWLFCWTEVGAEKVGVIQSLMSTCRLQGVNPYVYLVDVLQRISVHPASRVIELTPRVWKEKFADQPMVSDLDRQKSTV